MDQPHITAADIQFLKRAITLANDAEQQGNLPVGAVICYDGNIVAEGQNAIWYPTLYTTLEPCLMCLGAILLHRVGRVVFGTADYYGGAGKVAGHMPTFFEEVMAEIAWIGPAYPAACDPLHKRLRAIERPKSRPR